MTKEGCILKLSVIIPAHNEEKTIFELLRRVSSVDFGKLGVEKEIIVVDDHSIDKTASIVSHNFPQAILVSNDGKKGKGRALKKGINYSTGEIIIFQDADLEYNPQEYAEIIKPIIQRKAVAVYGSRYLTTHRPPGMYLSNNIGNKLVTFFFNILFKGELTDLMTCYKAFLGETLRSVPFFSVGFDVCPEITAKIKKRGIKILEVPISYKGRTRQEGKKIALLDAFFILSALLKFRFVD